MKRKLSFGEKQRPVVEVRKVYIRNVEEARQTIDSLKGSTLPFKEQYELSAILAHYINNDDGDSIFVYESDNCEYYIGSYAQEVGHE